MTHQWFTIEGSPYCSICGVSAANPTPDCRGPAEYVASVSKALAIERPLEIDLSQYPSRTHEEISEYRWETDTLPRLKAGGFESRFWKRIQACAVAGYEEDYKKWINILNLCRQKCKGVGAIVVLAGVRGTGKTTICAQMAIDRAEDEGMEPWDRQPQYRKLQALFEKYKALYSDFGSTHMDDLSSSLDWYCRTPQLAFIDEIHECKEAKIGERMLTDILDRRYSARRDTILITNQDAKEFRGTANGSIKSRIAEHGMIIPCEWRSWRGAK